MILEPVTGIDWTKVIIAAITGAPAFIAALVGVWKVWGLKKDQLELKQTQATISQQVAGVATTVNGHTTALLEKIDSLQGQREVLTTDAALAAKVGGRRASDPPLPEGEK